MASCKIRCLKCQADFNSPIQFGNAEAFFTSSLIGNLVQCPKCGQMTGCNKNNMIFRAPTEGFVGDDT